MSLFSSYSECKEDVLSLCLPSFLLGGNTSIDNNPKHDGDDGTSFLGPEGEPFLYPLKGNVKQFSSVKLVCSQHLQSGKLNSASKTLCLSARVNVFVLHCIMRKTVFATDIF